MNSKTVKKVSEWMWRQFPTNASYTILCRFSVVEVVEPVRRLLAKSWKIKSHYTYIYTYIVHIYKHMSLTFELWWLICLCIKIFLIILICIKHIYLSFKHRKLGTRISCVLKSLKRPKVQYQNNYILIKELFKYKTDNVNGCI